MMDKQFQAMIDITKQAGQIMLEAKNPENHVTVKPGTANFVTVYDQKVQAFLFEELAKIEPTANFLGEEDGKEACKPEYQKGLLFVIDPIDGTTNFILGRSCSVVSVGLFKDGRPFRAVVYNPYLDECFYAEKGKGAFMNGTQLHSSDKPLAESIVAIGSSPYYPEMWDDMFKRAAYYHERALDFRRSGSAEWDLCEVAAGRVGLYFEGKISLWDYAAGALLVTEAGGRITNIPGDELTYDGPSSVLAVSSGVAKEDYQMH